MEYIFIFIGKILVFKRGDDSPLSEGQSSIISSNPNSNQNPEHYPEGYLRQFSKKIRKYF